MAETLELWLIRHGETLWNTERRMQGVSDIALNELGIRQAQALAKRIGHESFDAIYASDLDRAKQTAAIVFPAASVVLDKRLREIDFGYYEGKVWSELSEEDHKQISVWFLGPYDKAVPGGESADDLRARVQDWLDDLPKTGRVIAFSHGGTINAFLQLITGRAKATEWNQGGGWGFRFKNTSISKIFLAEIYNAIEVVNDAAHLEKLELFKP